MATIAPWAILLVHWVASGATPTGIDLRCHNNSNTSSKLTIQGCVCDRASVVNDLYSSTQLFYPRTYCAGQKGFLAKKLAPENFCFGSVDNGLQKVIRIDTGIG